MYISVFQPYPELHVHEHSFTLYHSNLSQVGMDSVSDIASPKPMLIVYMYVYNAGTIELPCSIG